MLLTITLPHNRQYMYPTITIQSLIKKTKFCFNPETQDHEVNQCPVTREYLIKSTLELRHSRHLAVRGTKNGASFYFIENENGINFKI